MKLIVGLGNPGKNYQKTRHNIGFRILDEIAQKLDLKFTINKSFESAEAKINSQMFFIKPNTFMNDSGRAVVKVKNYYKINPNDIWVIHDDVDIEFGKIRISFGGSSAGQKGIQSLIDNIGNDFWRIRIGVSKKDSIPTEKWVLQNFNHDEAKIINQIIDKTANLVIESLSKDLKEETIKITD